MWLSSWLIPPSGWQRLGLTSVEVVIYTVRLTYNGTRHFGPLLGLIYDHFWVSGIVYKLAQSLQSPCRLVQFAYTFSILPTVFIFLSSVGPSTWHNHQGNTFNENTLYITNEYGRFQKELSPCRYLISFCLIGMVCFCLAGNNSHYKAHKSVNQNKIR